MHFLDKQTSVPIGMPRFYIDKPADVERIRSGAVSKLTIHVDIAWRETMGQNLICLIPGRQNTLDLTDINSAWIDRMIILQARYDASSQVFGRGPGAQQAANAAAVVDLAQRIAAAPDHCSVLIVLTAGDEWCFAGMRNFLEMLDPTEKHANAGDVVAARLSTAAEALAAKVGKQS